MRILKYGFSKCYEKGRLYKHLKDCYNHNASSIAGTE